MLPPSSLNAREATTVATKAANVANNPFLWNLDESLQMQQHHQQQQQKQQLNTREQQHNHHEYHNFHHQQQRSYSNIYSGYNLTTLTNGSMRKQSNNNNNIELHREHRNSNSNSINNTNLRQQIAEFERSLLSNKTNNIDGNSHSNNNVGDSDFDLMTATSIAEKFGEILNNNKYNIKVEETELYKVEATATATAAAAPSETAISTEIIGKVEDMTSVNSNLKNNISETTTSLITTTTTAATIETNNNNK